MTRKRFCSKPSCTQRAVATLTYVYGDCTAVLGPLATSNEPHCYDLCEQHAENLTAPRGWDVVRLDFDPDQYYPSSDDLEALANAVREAVVRPENTPATDQYPNTTPAGTVEIGRKGHLRVLKSTD